MTNISNPVSGIFCFDTPLLRVRRMAASDQTLYWQLYGSKEVMQWIAEPLTDTQLNNSFAAALKLNRGALSELAAGSRLFMVIAARPAESTVGLMAPSQRAIQQLILLPLPQRLALCCYLLFSTKNWLTRL